MKPAANLVQFLTASPTPYHAVHNCVLRLEAAGFTRLAEKSEWDIKPSGRYYVTRNQSSLIAFTVPTSFKAGVPHPVAIVGTHTDSCNFKLRPVSKRKPAGGNYLAVGVEAYGGGLWHTWLDRDLSVAGRVITASQDGKYIPHLVHIKKPLVRIPTVAIHLDRTQNDAMKYNPETSMQAILGLVSDQANASSGDAKNKDALDISANHHPRLLELIVEELASTGVKGVSGGKVAVTDIHDFELSLVDNQNPCLGGANDEFVFSARLDNLFSTFCAAEGLADSEPTKDTINLIAAYDNEEIGSVSAHGADSNFLEATILRVSGEPKMFDQAIANSFLLSCDMGHAVHPAPDHVSKHQSEHKPLMNQGPAIKTNAKIRYTSLATTTFLLRRLAEKAGVPLQEFVARNDMPCGSTISPILSSRLGVRSVDIGCVQLSMHSIRETAGSEDVGMLIEFFRSFFTYFGEVDATLKMDD